MKLRSTLPNRVLRNALLASALATGVTAASSIRTTSAHAPQGSYGTDPHSERFGNVIPWRQDHQRRRDVRDLLFASSIRSGHSAHHSKHLAKNHRPLGSSGIASVYSDRHTASGERMNPRAMTAAHRTLPFGTRVTVVNTHTGRSVVVRINDRGPFVGGRVIDLSPAAARAIGVRGLASVALKTGI